MNVNRKGSAETRLNQLGSRDSGLVKKLGNYLVYKVIVQNFKSVYTYP